MPRMIILAGLLLAASPVFAESYRESTERFSRYLEQKKTNDALRDIVEELRELRIQQQFDAPLINRGR